MSRFRTAAMGAVLVLGMAGVAGAQVQARPDSAGRMGRHGHMGQMGRGQEHGKFMSQLNLTDAQKASIKAIHAKYEPQMKTTHERSITIRQQEQSEVRAILTADQRTKWDAAQAQRKQRMEARQKGMKERGAQGGKRGNA